ncbi:hypothetical protein Pmani_010585 [Petrolisthes manimaculis]|uniref:Uncharacterized protein n=1 Tax=Petrolisthes manimaculis TaxID=1843537 RepID=A0AAE1Q4R2_9EUCA|nr:hypothetical protein Pmani_010585 [Petrolisthes manimaculis]
MVVISVMNAASPHLRHIPTYHVGVISASPAYWFVEGGRVMLSANQESRSITWAESRARRYSQSGNNNTASSPFYLL